VNPNNFVVILVVTRAQTRPCHESRNKPTLDTGQFQLRARNLFSIWGEETTKRVERVTQTSQR
jgi:hypothetical protein